MSTRHASLSYGVPRTRELCKSATEEVRAYTVEKAEQLVSKLEADGYPTLIRPLLPSHVSGCFWLGLPSEFCRKSLSRQDGKLTLVDEQGDEYPTVFLARKNGLSGGWKGFAETHELADGDAVIFQVITQSVLKVYIIRGSEYEASEE